MIGTQRIRAAWRAISLGSMAVLVAACGTLAQPAKAGLTINLRTLNGSGVTGTVAFSEVQGGRTRVSIAVNAGARPDMPAHIHPGTCDNLTPQPKYPLENVINGASTTEIPATVADLLASQVAVNLHASVNDLQTYTACADIR